MEGKTWFLKSTSSTVLEMQTKVRCEEIEKWHCKASLIIKPRRVWYRNTYKDTESGFIDETQFFLKMTKYPYSTQLEQ